jgi:hypothetical protein
VNAREPRRSPPPCCGLGAIAVSVISTGSLVIWRMLARVLPNTDQSDLLRWQQGETDRGQHENAQQDQGHHHGDRAPGVLQDAAAGAAAAALTIPTSLSRGLTVFRVDGIGLVRPGDFGQARNTWTLAACYRWAGNFGVRRGHRPRWPGMPVQASLPPGVPDGALLPRSPPVQKRRLAWRGSFCLSPVSGIGALMGARMMF